MAHGSGLIEVELQKFLAQKSGTAACSPGHVCERAQIAEAQLKRCFQDFFSDQSFASQLCLVATGGLGRQELALDSDLDLAIFSVLPIEELGETFREQINSFVAELWSWQKTVSVIFQTRKDLIRTFNDDLAGTTALLEGRLIAGSAASFAELKEFLKDEFFQSRLQNYIRRKIEELEERQDQAEAKLALSEPDIKNGCGGQRDVQIARLLLALRARSATEPQNTVVLSGMTRDHELILSTIREQSWLDVDQYLSAIELLDRVRHQIAELDGQYRLKKHQQQAIAERLNYSDLDDVRGVDRFLTDLYQARRNLHRLCTAVVSLSRQDLPVEWPEASYLLAPGIVARGAELELVPGAGKKIGLDLMLRAFEVSQKNKLGLSEATLVNLQQLTNDSTLRSDEISPDHYRAFMQLLSRAFDVAGVLRQMHEAGLLTRLLPEFKGVERQQFDAIREFTQDEQAFQSLEFLEGRNPWREQNQGARLSRIRHEIFIESPFRSILRLALLLHDSSYSAESKSDFFKELSERLQLSEIEAQLLICLCENCRYYCQLTEKYQVRGHETASSLLQHVQFNQTKLDSLYIAAVAYSNSLAPDSISSWRDSLYARLFDTTTSLLTEAFADRSRALIEHFPESQHAQLREHLKLTPASYADESEPFDVRNDLELIQSLPESQRHFQIHIDQNVVRITFVSKSWKQRFSEQTGLLASLNVSVLDARLWTRADGLNIDRFIIGYDARLDLKGLQSKLEERMAEQRLERVELITKVRAASRSFPRSFQHDQFVGDKSVEIEFGQAGETEARSAAAVLTIQLATQDRLGLLFDIARVFEAHQLQVNFAKISTQGQLARDHFEVKTEKAEFLNTEALKFDLASL